MFLAQTPLGVCLGLGMQPHYKAPSAFILKVGTSSNEW